MKTQSKVKKGERSKQRFLEATADLLARQGYHATGLNQIVKQSGAPKGSLYFHFPGGKEELAARALSAAGEETYAELGDALAGATGIRDVLDRLVGYFARQLEESRFELGCPVATVALEAAATSEKVRGAACEVYQRWQELAARFAAATGLEEEEARQVGLFMLSAIEGAMLLCRVYRSTEPLEVAARQLEQLLAPRA